MVIDHIGIAVKSLDDGIRHWQTVFGYGRMTEPVVNMRQKVRVVFLGKANSTAIKLVEAISKESPVYSCAAKGGGLHHLCFKCADVEHELARLRRLGMRVLAGPEPGEAFEGEKIAFVYADQGLNIELIDTARKARLLPTSGARIV